ncbi:MAG: acetyl-CoA hydrolase [Burkholderiaceae bacterium]|nr:acetyl-CoA hydrolase [Roseateles sp.]MBV8471071.1 acetyl-CoA hydrolase [Burkholderiaceae bacterium]
MSSSALMLHDLEAAVDAVLQRIEGAIVMALPLGIGKPNRFVNALYRRIKADGRRQLQVFTALSLEKPVGASELERHFMGPLVERVFADYPDFDYLEDLRHGRLPANIVVHEFFFKTGDYLHNDAAQSRFVCTNYSMVVRDMMALGVNLIAQAVAVRREAQDPQGLQLSLSCNPDLTLELVERCAQASQPLMTVAVVNEALPFMPGDAVLPLDVPDLVVDCPAGTHTLFAPPNAAIGWADYAIGLHASSLVRDGGTLQIGIGSLGDAIAQSLIVRDRENETYRSILSALNPQGLADRECEPFKEGLYGCSEMFVNGIMRLIDAGIVRRRVFMDEDLQALSRDLGPHPDANVLAALRKRGRIGSALTADNLSYLKRFGILDDDVQLDGEHLQCGALRIANRLDSDAALDAFKPLLGRAWRRAYLMHGGFFLGPRDFYQRLREMPEALREQIGMTRISFINELWNDSLGSEALKRAQRVKASLMNTTMRVSLLGAASSDALDSGQVVSGVGGQYNFVAMGHALSDARSILMLRATHQNRREGLTSSIHWACGNVTIPRHLRDIVVTEYGVAELRGQPDGEVIRRLLAIADSRFQQSLLAEAKAAGKLDRDYQIPEAQRHNTPERLRACLQPWRDSGQLPDFPFGTDLNADELTMVRALRKLQAASTHPVELVKLAFKSLTRQPAVPPAYLQRLGLDEAHSFKQLLLRRLFAANL